MTFSEEKRDPDLREKLRAELPGILNRALEGLRRVRSRTRFDPEGVFAGSREQWQKRSNPMQEFLAARETGETLWSVGADLYRDYVLWCQENEEKPVSDTVFGKRLRQVLPLSLHQRQRVNGEPSWVYTWVGGPKDCSRLEKPPNQKTLDGEDRTP